VTTPRSLVHRYQHFRGACCPQLCFSPQDGDNWFEILALIYQTTQGLCEVSVVRSAIQRSVCNLHSPNLGKRLAVCKFGSATASMLILFPTKYDALVTVQGWTKAKRISVNTKTFFVKCRNVCSWFTLLVVLTMHVGRKCVSTLH
jgi:hypothetical protein